MIYIPGSFKRAQKMGYTHPLHARLKVRILSLEMIIVLETQPFQQKVERAGGDVGWTSQISSDETHDMTMWPERFTKSAAAYLVYNTLKTKRKSN